MMPSTYACMLLLLQGAYLKELCTKQIMESLCSCNSCNDPFYSFFVLQSLGELGKTAVLV